MTQQVAELMFKHILMFHPYIRFWFGFGSVMVANLALSTWVRARVVAIVMNIMALCGHVCFVVRDSQIVAFRSTSQIFTFFMTLLDYQ